jgi:hypothetical protein
LIFKFTKSRRNFYTQIERRSFYTAKTQSGPRAHRIAFRKAAVLDHGDTSKRERRSIVAQSRAVQGAEGITRSSARAAGVISDSI